MTEHTNIELPQRTFRLFLLVAAAGIVIILAGLFVATQRTWANILLGSYYLVGVGVAAALLVAFASVSNAGWLTAMRRIPEALASSTHAGGGLMIILLFGLHHLYEWSHHEVVALDHLLQQKSFWLNVPFFSVRTIVYVAIWSVSTYALVRVSREQDKTGDITLTAKHRRHAAVFIVAFALTFWIASMDWIMSLEPHWYSTIFGIYNFSGSFLAGIAAVTVAVIQLRRRGYLKEFIREDHLHDLGKLLFAFSTFWMYIWFSQYILIWYANIPEETVYFLKRETAGWGTFTALVILFNWVIPFVTLMSKSAKRNEALLMRVSVIVLVGHWLDLFWMIMPTFMPDAPRFGIWEAGPVLAAAGLCCLTTARSLSRANLVPINDPMLVESLGYHS